MNRSFEVERQTLIDVLRPFARAYAGLAPIQQIALAEWAPIRVSYLRDAYLLLAQLERKTA